MSLAKRRISRTGVQLLLPIFFVAAAIAAPSPSPTPLKTIVNERVTPLCTSLHTLVMPSMQIVLNNETLFANARRDLSKVHEAITTFAPGAVRGRIGDSDALHRAIALPLANTQWNAYQILSHVAAIDRALADSYRQFPTGTNPRLDALRLRVENIAKLERAYANSLLAEASLIGDNTPIPGKADAFQRRTRGTAAAGDPDDKDNAGLNILQFASDETLMHEMKGDTYVSGRSLDPLRLLNDPPQSLRLHLLFELNDIKAPALSLVQSCDATKTQP